MKFYFKIIVGAEDRRRGLEVNYFKL